MKQRIITVTAINLLLAASMPAMAEDTTSDTTQAECINQRLDYRGDMIEQCLDPRGENINERLDCIEGRFKKNWTEIPEQRKQRLLKGAKRWQTMTPNNVNVSVPAGTTCLTVSAKNFANGRKGNVFNDRKNGAI